MSEHSIQQAVLVRDWSRDLTLFTKGTFSPDPDPRAQLETRGIRIATRVVETLTGDARRLTGVQLADAEVIAVDALFMASLACMASLFANQLGCVFEDGMHGPIVRTNERKKTTVPGVYCAGDASRSMHNATLRLPMGLGQGWRCMSRSCLRVWGSGWKQV